LGIQIFTTDSVLFVQKKKKKDIAFLFEFGLPFVMDRNVWSLAGMTEFEHGTFRPRLTLRVNDCFPLTLTVAR